MPLMISHRDLRLTNRCGHVILVEANKPVNVPAPLHDPAVLAGMQPVDPAFPIDPPVPEPTAIKEPVEPDPEPAPSVNVRGATIESAMRAIIARGDERDFKADGTPKVYNLMALLPDDFEPRPTATEVLDIFEQLQEDLDLAED